MRIRHKIHPRSGVVKVRTDKIQPITQLLCGSDHLVEAKGAWHLTNNILVYKTHIELFPTRSVEPTPMLNEAAKIQRVCRAVWNRGRVYRTFGRASLARRIRLCRVRWTSGVAAEGASAGV
jgi:hypothetical protein